MHAPRAFPKREDATERSSVRGGACMERWRLRRPPHQAAKPHSKWRCARGTWPTGRPVLPLRAEGGWQQCGADDSSAHVRERPTNRRPHISAAPEVPVTAALPASRTRDIFPAMSTAELISKLRALSPRERDRVVRAVRPVKKTAGRAAGSSKTATRKVTWPDLAALKRKIYGDRVLPNLVLLEREEMRY